MPTPDLLPLFLVFCFTGIVILFVLRARNPKLTALTIGPLFLFLVAGIIGVGRLYLMGAMLLSVCAACSLLARRSLHGVKITRYVDGAVMRGERCRIRLEITNQDSLPKLFLRVCCPLPPELQSAAQTFLIPGLSPGQQVTFHLEALATKRGCYSLAPVEAVGADPLDVFQRSAQFDAPAEVVVFPRPIPVPALTRGAGGLSSGRVGQRALSPTDAQEFSHLRDYQEGDDLRSVDWKSTARLNQLTVRVFEPDPVGDLVLLLDNRDGVQRGVGDDSSLERGIAMAATVIADVLASRGRVQLRYLDRTGVRETAGQGIGEQIRFLDVLARIETHPGSMASLLPAITRGQSVLLITPDAGPDADALLRRMMAAGCVPQLLVPESGGEGSAHDRQ